MNPQILVLVRVVIIFAAGILASRGVISKEMQDYLAGPETLAVLGTVAAGLVAFWGWWSQRPKARVAAAAATPGVQAVIAEPQIANSSATPSNVVATAAEAARLPGVSH